MNLASELVFLLLTLFSLVQALLVVGFVFRLLKYRRELVADARAPKAAVILCLRGSDPFLRDCIRGLLDQDYPDYIVQVVVDHQDDPAMAVLEEFLNDSTRSRLHLQVLTNPSETCSLKCSSLVQAIRALDESVEFIAQLDADTVPHRTWLRELASALQDDNVGAATGNRWYMPAQPSLGSLVRYSWNAAAIVQMFWYRIAWGGTLAIKTRVFRDSDLLERWNHALCEDTMLFAELKRLHLRIEFVPTLMMINRENCDVRGFFDWVCRQLVTARLYHPAWPAVMSHGVLCSIAPWLALGIGLTALGLGNFKAALVSFSGLAIYELSVILLLLPMEVAIRRIIASRGEQTHWLGGRGAIKQVWAMQVTQVLYAIGLLSASRTRLVNWRGVAYRIDDSGRIKLVEYKQYIPSTKDAKASL